MGGDVWSTEGTTETAYMTPTICCQSLPGAEKHKQMQLWLGRFYILPRTLLLCFGGDKMRVYREYRLVHRHSLLMRCFVYGSLSEES